MRLTLTFSVWSLNVDQWKWIVVWFFAYNVLDSQIFSFLQNNEAKCLRNQDIEANWLEWLEVFAE